jgi:hypothetical protein
MRVVTIMDLLPIAIIEGSRGLHRPEYRRPVLSLLLIVVPLPVVTRWWNGEGTIDLAQILIVHGTSFCVEPQRSCPTSLALIGGTTRYYNCQNPSKGVNFDYEFNIRNGGYYQILNAKLPEPVWLRALLGDDYE